MGGVAVMITGTAVLGWLAGSLTSFSGSVRERPRAVDRAAYPAAASPIPSDEALQVLAAEVSALRLQVKALTLRASECDGAIAPGADSRAGRAGLTTRRAAMIVGILRWSRMNPPGREASEEAA